MISVAYASLLSETDSFTLLPSTHYTATHVGVDIITSKQVRNMDINCFQPNQRREKCLWSASDYVKPRAEECNCCLVNKCGSCILVALNRYISGYRCTRVHFVLLSKWNKIRFLSSYVPCRLIWHGTLENIHRWC